MYIYMYMYVCIYTYMQMFMDMHKDEYMYVNMRVCIYVYVYVYGQVYVYLYLYLYLYVYVCVYGYVYVYVHAYVYVCVWVCGNVCGNVQAHSRRKCSDHCQGCQAASGGLCDVTWPSSIPSGSLGKWGSGIEAILVELNTLKFDVEGWLQKSWQALGFSGWDVGHAQRRRFMTLQAYGGFREQGDRAD